MPGGSIDSSTCSHKGEKSVSFKLDDTDETDSKISVRSEVIATQNETETIDEVTEKIEDISLSHASKEEDGTVIDIKLKEGATCLNNDEKGNNIELVNSEKEKEKEETINNNIDGEENDKVSEMEVSEEQPVVIDALEALFLEVDKNNDGDVSRKEIMHILNEKDGQRSLLKERVCITLGLHPKICGPEARTVFNAVFDCVDSDHTHTISLIEMRNFVENIEIFVEMYAEVHENSEVAWPVPLSVHQVLKYTKPRKDGTLDHSQIIHSLKEHADVREAILDRRMNGPPRKKNQNIKLHNRLSKEQSMQLDEMNEDNTGACTCILHIYIQTPQPYRL